MIAVFLDVLLISLVFNLCLFLVAYFFQTDKLTDLSYSLSFIAVGTYAVFRFNADSLFHKLLLALVILWALRLGSYLFIRVHKMSRDKRFDGIREKFISFLGFWIMQGVSVAIIINALSFASWYGDLNPGYLSYALVILSLLALILEAVADHQKFTFKIKQPSRFMQTGLWKKIRHPNYLGEILFWTFLSLSVTANLPIMYWTWTLIGPLWLIFLLIFFSGIPPLEKKWNEKYSGSVEFKEYINQSWRLIPGIY